MWDKTAFVLIITNFLSAMGITVVVPFIGNTQSIFGVDPAYGIWLVTAFMLSYCVGMGFVGRLSDAVGRRPVYIGAMGTLALGLFLSALAPSFEVVLAGRFLQGLGASGTLPLAQAIAYERFGRRRGRVMGLISAAFGIGVVAAINLGGGVYSALGWRAVFAITGGLASLGLAASLLLPHASRTSHPVSLDIPGIVSLAVAIMAFMLLFKGLSEFPLLSGKVLPYFALLLVSGAAFVVFERRAQSPAVDPALFHNRTFSLVIAASFLGGIGMFIFQTFLPSYAQVLLGYSVAQASYSIDVMAAFMILFSGLTGVACDRFGPERGLIFSLGTTATAFVLITSLPAPVLSYYLGSAVAGMGLGSLIPPTGMIAIREGGPGQEGISSGIVSLARTTGGIVGPTVAGLILARTDFSSLFALTNLLDAYRRIYLFGFWAVAAGAVVAAALFILSRKGADA